MFELLIFLIFLKSSNSSYEHKNSEMAKILHRPIRALSYPDASTMGIFFALAVPLPDPEKSISLSYFFEASYQLPPNTTILEPWSDRKRKKRGIDRVTIYRTLENKFESSGFSGRGCLLRSICETSKFNLDDNGVLGDVINVIFNIPDDVDTFQAVDFSTRGSTAGHCRGRNDRTYWYLFEIPFYLSPGSLRLDWNPRVKFNTKCV